MNIKPDLEKQKQLEHNMDSHQRKKKSTNVASMKVHILPRKAKKNILKPKTLKKKGDRKCCECNTICESK